MKFEKKCISSNKKILPGAYKASNLKGGKWPFDLKFFLVETFPIWNERNIVLQAGNKVINPYFCFLNSLSFQKWKYCFRWEHCNIVILLVDTSLPIIQYKLKKMYSTTSFHYGTNIYFNSTTAAHSRHTFFMILKRVIG